ncbi:MAG: hypothetical protein IH947_09105 [Bacteroidetes bacterium]|nr:hypothetical protein [Bacteroidota bacterium]
MDDDPAGRREYNKLKRDLFNDVEEEANKKLLKIKGCKGIEDLFSISDFKKFIIENKSADLGEFSNAEYLSENHISKGVLALRFKLSVENGKLKFADLTKVSQDNIMELVKKIETLLN